jgi:predicted CXXCH cytochrome family protein
MYRYPATRNTDRRELTHLRAIGYLLGVIAVAAMILVLVSTQRASAQEEPERKWNSELCLDCHDGSEDVLTFPSGEEIGIDVDANAFRDTHLFVRAQLSGDLSRSFAGGVQCVHCHTNITGIPHEDVTAPDVATYTAELSNRCRQCHWRQYTVERDEAHALVPVDKREDAPRCIDCHEPHAPRALTVEDAGMQQMCRECHDEPAWTEIQAIHTLDPTVVEEATAPPIILFYVSILGGIVALIALLWGVVILSERVRARSRPSSA